MKEHSSSPKDEEIFNLMVFVYRKLSKPFEDYFKGRFTSLQINALCILCTSGPMTMGELAACLHTPPQQMSRMIEKLYEEGHIVRSYDPSDRRKIRISVSEDTARYIVRGKECFANSLRTFMDTLDEKDCEEFKSAVHSVTRILTKIPQT
jgi:DNA-binding MarR family transcriptional regulator